MTSSAFPEAARLTHVGTLLEALLRGERLTRMEAWQRYGDGALNSTVSRAQSDYQLLIARSGERVQGRGGRTAWVARYWLDDSQRQQARKALAVEYAKSGLYRTPGEALAALEGKG